MIKIVEVKKSERRLDTSLGMRRGYNAFNAAPRVYFWQKEYNPIEEIKTGARWNKPYNLFRNKLPEVFKQVDIDPKLKSVCHWSQRAGCGCGCSPAFIMKDQRGGYDIHVQYVLE